MTSLDYILLAALVIVLPAEALWHSVARRDRPKRPLSARLARSLRVIVVLLVLLGGIWWSAGRPVALLGLEAPLSTGGTIGLAIAVTIIVLLGFLMTARKPATGDVAATAGILPQTTGERRLYILFAFAAGIGWELLYRGFLIWALVPWIGTIGAVIVAAIAYALGHGSRDTKALIGSTVSSFLFTIGYVLTGSLWWLILLHTALPLIGLIAMRPVRAARA